MCAKGTAHFLTSPKIPDAKGIFVMIQFTPVGDSGVLAVCGSEISEQVNAQVMALDAAVQAAQLPGVVETAVSYTHLDVYKRQYRHLELCGIAQSPKCNFPLLGKRSPLCYPTDKR